MYYTSLTIPVTWSVELVGFRNGTVEYGVLNPSGSFFLQ
jgi:hypothetical protein